MSALTMSSTDASLEWGAATMAMPGENVVGDRFVVAFAGRQMLLTVIDGVGHGPKAAAAAQVAAYTLKHSADEDVASAVLECHRALHDTRGAALSVGSIDLDKHTLRWLGVGNVEGRLIHTAEPIPVTDSLLMRSGIVGHELPRLIPQTMPLAHGDLVIFATDGIRRDFADDLMPRGSCQQLADRILQQHVLGSDDALVLVARYLTKT